MKLNLVKDNTGKVVATYESAQAGGPSVAPELDSSHTVHEIDVAENYMSTIQSIYSQNSK
jgi:hypothetical protein